MICVGQFLPCATPSAKSPAISLPVETAANSDWRLAISDWQIVGVAISHDGNGSE
jgi:hypothetical protein